MRVLTCAFLLLTIASVPLRAEEASKTDKREKKQDVWTGTLEEAPKTAKAGVIALLKFTKDDKEIVVNLWASGETAATLKEWAVQKVEVTVTGNKVDETDFKVSKVEKK